MQVWRLWDDCFWTSCLFLGHEGCVPKSPDPEGAGVAGLGEGALVVLGPVRPPLLGAVCAALCAL